jgi:PAS domain S-box-containing protein
VGAGAKTGSFIEPEVRSALLGWVLDQLPVAVVVAEAPSGRVILTNEHVSRVWPHAREDWPLARSLRHGETVHGELIDIVRDDGTPATVEVSSAPVRDDEGQIVAVVGVLADVTARERRERVEREFVTNAAHELQTPLAAITSAIEVLQGGAKERPEDRDRFLAHIERETDRLTRLAHSLLTLARAELAAEAPRRELVDIAELLADVAGLLRPSTGTDVVIDCVEGLALVSNRELVEQAVTNVAQNAARHTQAGRIVLAARAVGDSVMVEVADTGSGIATEDRSRVFRRFYRSGTDSGGHGFGLGLAIARSATEAVGGTIELESEAGVGTKVRLTFPSAARFVRR